jgi:ubiquinone/menaquinone biosynthesis C-methylase UbiE
MEKRQAWATRIATETCIREMGAYAVARDEQIVRGLLGRGPGRLLDLPCGTGRFLEIEKELGFRVTAADYSPTMLEVARRHREMEFFKADAFSPPFAPARLCWFWAAWDC